MQQLESNLKDKVEVILSKIKSLDVNDDKSFNHYFDEIFTLLKADECQTILLLNSLSESEIDWLTPMFADLSAVFQSQRFIACLEELQQTFADIHLMQESIKWAKEAID